MGEVILRSMLQDTGLADEVQVDSAGIGDWHAGDPADPRTLATLARKGYDGTAHRAHQITADELADRDLVLAADRSHVRDLLHLAGGSEQTPDIRLIREFDPIAMESGDLEVDDPYYGNASDFDRCRDEVETACRGLVAELQTGLR